MTTAGDGLIAVAIERSSLRPTNGVLKLRLIQDVVGIDDRGEPKNAPVVGDRMGIAHSIGIRDSTQGEQSRARTRIENATESDLTVVAFERGLDACRHDLTKIGAGHVLVAGLNTVIRHAGQAPQNVTLVAADGCVTELDKCSLSSDDLHHGVRRGAQFSLFLPETTDADSIRWAVFNCHEYTHSDLLELLVEHEIELLVVVTTHGASRLYWEYATADVHRLFCYVVIANIAEVGGSGVFAPFRRVGREKNAQLSAAGQVFGARGPARFSVDIDLEIGEIRSLRTEFATRGFWAGGSRAEQTVDNSARDHHPRHGGQSHAGRSVLAVEPVVPSEHFLHTLDKAPGPPVVKSVIEVPHRFTAGTLRVALGQLTSMRESAYIDTQYRIRKDPSVGLFTKRLAGHLQELELRCGTLGPAPSGALLDMLVLPEVFVPRSFMGSLQELSDRLGCTVIAGVDYPGSEEAENANECQILRPNCDPITYRKITRSQYDALKDYGGNRMPMARGDSLVRFVDSEAHGFGVLICYDFSHLDLIHKINLQGRAVPLEIMVVVAHNPFGELYRSCCLADSHRYYQYVLMCNVAKYGGSGIFGPIRTAGARQTLVNAGKGVDALAIANLDLKGLRAARMASDEELNSTGGSTGMFMRRPGVFQARRQRSTLK